MARTYKVLKIEPDSDNAVLVRLADIEASSGEQAIRLAAIDEGTGRYCAVPESNWTEIGVRVEIPAPRVIFDTDEPTAAVEDEAVEELERGLEGPIEGAATYGHHDETLDDEEFQARKEELSARRQA